MQRKHALSLFLAALLLASSNANADRHFGGWHPGFRHHHFNPSFGFYLGVPWYPRSYYSYPYYPYYPYYPQSIVTVPVEPPVYIERNPPQTQQLPSGYWYYCSNPEGYYPYVKECPSGWRQVDPIPPQ